jgi:hypothetical protein
MSAPDYTEIIQRRYAALITACEQLGAGRRRGASDQELANLNGEAVAALWRLVEIAPEVRDGLPAPFQIEADRVLEA